MDPLMRALMAPRPDGARIKSPMRIDPPRVAGRVPPHDLGAEAAVLSAILLDRDAFDSAIEILKPEHFYSEANGRIFQAACALAETTPPTPIDMVSVASWLRDREWLKGVGGTAYLAELADATPAVSHVAAHARVVHDKWRLRAHIATCQRAAAEGYGDVGDVQGFIVETTTTMELLVQGGESGRQLESVGDTLTSAFEEITAAAERGDRITGVATGYDRLDAKTAGMHEGDLIIVAARPGMGKSAIVLNIATNVASPRSITMANAEGPPLELVEPGLGVCVFSLEMPRKQLVTRMACSEGRVDLGRVRQGHLHADDWRRLTEAAVYLKQLPIWIDDTPALGLVELRAKVRRKQSQWNRKATATQSARRVGLVIVDYLQLMKGRDGARSREQEISEISRGLKNLAKELKVPVIALSQLNRAVETRTTKDKRPQLSDLRECVTGDTVVLDAVTGAGVTVRELARGRRAVVYGLREHDYKVAVAPVARAWSTGVRPVFRLRTRTGRALRATGNHPLRTARGWVELRDVAVGERIAAPRVLPQHAMPVNGHSADELRLLGYLISDGHYGVNRSVGYVKADRELVADVRRIALERFKVVAKDHPCEGKAEQVDLTVPGCGPGGNPVIEWLKGLGVHGELGPEKRVPESVFRCDNDLLGIFLGALWSGDGSVVPRKGGGWCLKFTSTSMGLLDDVQRCLLRLGIIAVRGKPERNSKSKRDIATIVVSDGDALLQFVESVELRGEKARKLVQAAEDARSRRRENAHVDRVPLAVTEEVRRAANAGRLSWSQLGYRCQGKEMSREMLGRVAARLGRKDLADLATSDVLWDEVVSIEADGEEEVFDLSVPGMHNFVANGLFVHNSGAIEQDADTIIFIYRDDYYNPETSDLKGIAELIIAKQRNGPTGKVKVRFSASCTRFDNLEPGDYRETPDE